MGGEKRQDPASWSKEFCTEVDCIIETIKENNQPDRYKTLFLLALLALSLLSLGWFWYEAFFGIEDIGKSQDIYEKMIKSIRVLLPLPIFIGTVSYLINQLGSLYKNTIDEISLLTELKINARRSSAFMSIHWQWQKISQLPCPEHLSTMVMELMREEIFSKEEINKFDLNRYKKTVKILLKKAEEESAKQTLFNKTRSNTRGDHK